MAICNIINYRSTINNENNIYQYSSEYPPIFKNIHYLNVTIENIYKCTSDLQSI